MKTRIQRVGYGLLGAVLSLALPVAARADTFTFDEGDEYRSGVGGGLIVEGDLVETIINIVQWGLGLIGLIMVVMIIYAGFTMMLSQGNEQRMETSKQTIRYAVIGLAVVMLSYAIITLAFGVVTGDAVSP